MNFIEELFYGNLQPNNQSFSKNSAYKKAISTIAKSEELLTEKLDDDLKPYLFTLVNTQLELNGITAYENFANGFKLGAHFMRDIFLTKQDYE